MIHLLHPLIKINFPHRITRQLKTMTTPLFLQDTYLFECDASVVSVKESNDEKNGSNVLVLDQSIFHPRGGKTLARDCNFSPYIFSGGQPADSGTISTSESQFEVKDVKKGESHEIEHYGDFSKGSTFKVGEKVHLRIDNDARKLYARLHSAGHLLDVAVNNLKLDFKPGKGEFIREHRSHHFLKDFIIHRVLTLNILDLSLPINVQKLLKN